MLKFGNKEFRNLQEQVLKNMQNIANIKEGTAVLDEFGIKVVGEVDTLADLPSVADYKAAHQDWEYGDAFAVGTTAPYSLYILTRENDKITADHWFDIGDFPAPGPQGAQGPQGEVGPQGQQGNQGEPGVDAGFGSILATAQTLPAGSVATATVTASGPNTAKEFSFTFGIPRGADGGQASWGNILGDLEDQTDLQDALDSKQDELVSGTNIKTINNQSIVGSGNIEINSGVWGNITGTLSDQTDLQTALNAKANTSSLATVATTGAYADLSGKPTIGTGTITIKKNGETVDSFGLNQTADQNINITVPTKTSDLSNDSNFTSKTYVDDGLALKQDVISDLSDIRAGAALGATALQSIPSEYITDSELATELATKQDVISDLSDIRSGAAAGATAVQPATLQTELASKQDVISDLASIRSGAAAGATAVQPAAIADMMTTDTNQLDLSGEKTWLNVYDPLQSGSPSNYTASVKKVNNQDFRFFVKYENNDKSAIKSTSLWVDGLTLYEKNTSKNIDKMVNYKTDGIYINDDYSDTWTTFKLPQKLNSQILACISDIPTKMAWTNITGKPTFATVATSGSYNDLSNKPTIPTNYVTTNTGTSSSPQQITGYKQFTNTTKLSIAAIGGTNVSDTPLNITYHSGYSSAIQIKDRSLYTTSIGIAKAAYVGLTLPATSGTVALTSDIPTNNNQLTNGAGYQTASDVSTAIAGQTKETWTFTLSDGTTVTKTIILG